MQSTPPSTSTSKCHSNVPGAHGSTSLTCSCVLCNAQNLHVTPERFKDICLKTPSLYNESPTSITSNNNNGSSSSSSNNSDLNTVLDYFFDPNKKLNSPKNNVDMLKTYLIGTSSSTYDNYKAKRKIKSIIEKF